LIRLSNARRNASRRLPQHHTIVQNNGTLDTRTVQSNISPPHLADNVATACTEQPEGSSYGNRGAKQSNPSVLPFLETYTPRGFSYILAAVAHRGTEDFEAENPLVKLMRWLIWTNLANINTIELQHLSSEVEGEIRTTYGDEDDMEGDDEHEDNDGNVYEEAPNNPNIHI
jgi:hypothetical protein